MKKNKANFIQKLKDAGLLECDEDTVRIGNYYKEMLKMDNKNLILATAEQVVKQVNEQIKEAHDWAVEQFLKDNPDCEESQFEIILRPDNHFAYYVRRKTNAV